MLTLSRFRQPRSIQKMFIKIFSDVVLAELSSQHRDQMSVSCRSWGVATALWFCGILRWVKAPWHHASRGHGMVGFSSAPPSKLACDLFWLTECSTREAGL